MAFSLGQAGQILGACVVTVFAFLIFRAIYYVWFHPLSKYPAPKLWAASRLVWVYHEFKGDLIFHLQELHDKYGPVVRIAPDELSFIDPAAWKDIYTGTGSKQLPRDPYIFPPDLPGLPGGILSADSIRHQFLRRQLSYAFSQRAMEEQVPLIQSHIDVLIRQFHGLARTGTAINFADWMNYTSFDIIGHLSFGESFDCLESGKYHPYAAFVLDAVIGSIFASAFNRYGLLHFVDRLLPAEMARKRNEFIQMSIAAIEKRIAEKDVPTSQRPDFISYMMKADKNDQVMTKGDLVTNAIIFIVAGSESTAALLSGTLWYLLKDPDRMTKVTDEVRSAFQSEDEINLPSTSKLPYLLACLEEGLRIVTPAPFGVARRTTTPTAIAGTLVPKNTSVSVPQFAAWHSDRNFVRPLEFIPERWLEGKEGAGEEFATDAKSGFHPFSVGPRHCIGKNLAYMEMRLILARLLWNFDFELLDRDFAWNKQKAYIVWDKKPLMVRVRSARA